MSKGYVKIETGEFKVLLVTSLILGVMFALTFVRFASEIVSLFANIVLFFLFILVLLSLRLLFMKFVAYRNGFEMSMRDAMFDRYWFNNYDRISYSFPGVKGIPMIFVSLILYVLTLGLIIFPSTWKYDMKVIPHRHIGKRLMYDKDMFEGISFYRYGKMMFAGYLFYLVFALFIKVFEKSFDEYFYWFIFVIFWIAFVNMIPILGTEGFNFFSRAKFGWISAFVILCVGLLALLAFESLMFVVVMGVVSVFIVMLVLLWKRLV